jgi:hypothetical protein
MTLLQPALSLSLTSLLACLGLGSIAPPPASDRPGDCGTFSCPELLAQLQQRYPDHIADYLGNCPSDPAQGYATEGELALNVYERDGSQRVGFYCWEPPHDQGGDRSGFVLGILPYPGEEAGFPVAIASDDPAIQAELERYAPMVSQMGFDCAVAGGEINILSEARQMSLQCYFWAGAILIDTNDDGVADGELSMGASVDFTRELGRDSSQNRGTPVDLMQSR